MLGTSGPTAADPLPLALDRRTGRRTDLADSCSAPLGPSNHRVTSQGIAVGSPQLPTRGAYHRNHYAQRARRTWKFYEPSGNWKARNSSHARVEQIQAILSAPLADESYNAAVHAQRCPGRGGSLLRTHVHHHVCNLFCACETLDE
jgi:hypothetical protein